MLPWWCAPLAAVLLAGAITLLALWCQPNALRAVLKVFRGQELLIVLNALPVGLLLLAIACLLRNVFYGAAVVNLVVGALSIANCIKIEVRDEPVFPRDFALLKEVGSAMGPITSTSRWEALRWWCSLRRCWCWQEPSSRPGLCRCGRCRVGWDGCWAAGLP